MRSHKELAELITKLGYELPPQGVCYGYAASWVQSACIGGASEKEFYRRVARLLALQSTSSILRRIHRATRNQSKGEATLEDRQFIAAKAWLEDIALAQNLISTNEYLEVTGRGSEAYIKPQEIMPFMASCEILRQGGLKNWVNASLVMNGNELRLCLDLMQESVVTVPHALLFHTPLHTFALKFVAERSTFLLLDVEFLERAPQNKIYKEYSLADAVNVIKERSFVHGEYLALNLSLYTTERREINLDSFVSFYDRFKELNCELQRRDSNGFGLLTLHVYEKNEAAALKLIKHGYDLTSELALEERNIFYLAFLNNLYRLSKRLIKLGLVPEILNRKPLLSFLVSDNRYRFAELLLTVGGMTLELSNNEHNLTALHYAILKKRDHLAMLLLKKGACVNAKTRKGKTALHLAAFGRHSKALYLCLLSHGANQSIQDENNETPLDLACLEKNAVAIDVLLEEALVNQEQITTLVKDRNLSVIKTRLSVLLEKPEFRLKHQQALLSQGFGVMSLCSLNRFFSNLSPPFEWQRKEELVGTSHHFHR